MRAEDTVLEKLAYISASLGQQTGRKHDFSHLPPPHYPHFLHSLLLHFHKAYEDRVRTKVQQPGEEGEGRDRDTWLTENGQERGHHGISGL